MDKGLITSEIAHHLVGGLDFDKIKKGMIGAEISWPGHKGYPLVEDLKDHVKAMLTEFVDTDIEVLESLGFRISVIEKELSYEVKIEFLLESNYETIE